MVAGNLWAPGSSPLTGRRCRQPCALLFWAVALSSHLLLLPKHLHPSSQAAVAALTETEETPAASPTTDPCPKPWQEEALHQTWRTPKACPGNDAQVQAGGAPSFLLPWPRASLVQLCFRQGPGGQPVGGATRGAAILQWPLAPMPLPGSQPWQQAPEGCGTTGSIREATCGPSTSLPAPMFP